MSNLPEKSQFLIYQAQNGAIKIDVRFEGETVWLTQQAMAELFQSTQQNISLHLRNIYEEGELAPEATHKEFLSVRREGDRDVQRSLDYYNLCLLYTSDAADDLLCVDLGGRRIIKKKKKKTTHNNKKY